MIIVPFADNGVQPLAIFPSFLRFFFFLSSPLSERIGQAFVNVVQRSNVLSIILPCEQWCLQAGRYAPVASGLEKPLLAG